MRVIIAGGTGLIGQAIGRALNRPHWLPVPGFAMKLAFGEVVDLLLKGQRGIPRRLLEMGFSFRFPTAELALRDLLAQAR